MPALSAAPVLTVRSISVRAALVPLRRPIVAKIGVFDRWPLLLVDIETGQGITGRSYIGPYLKDSARAIMAALRDLAAARAGTRLCPADDYRAGRRQLNLLGYEGIAMAAVSALDMAAWDALAQAAGMPLAVFLGGSLGAVRAYNSTGLWLGTGLDALGDEAAALAAEGGFAALKLRLGRDRLADDVRAIRAVRDALAAADTGATDAGARGDPVLMVDFNQGLSLGDALHRCRGLDDEGLYWFEEPIVYDNLAGYARLRAALATPVQLGENFYGPRALHQALAAGAGDYVMPDLMRIGGVTGWLRAAALAGAAGVEMSSHLYPEFSAHLLRVTETAHWLEWADWADPILAEPFVPAAGAVTVPDRPGAGIAWNEAAVRVYAYDP